MEIDNGSCVLIDVCGKRARCPKDITCCPIIQGSHDTSILGLVDHFLPSDEVLVEQVEQGGAVGGERVASGNGR